MATVLIVDDSLFMVRYLAIGLGPHGLETRQASTRAEVLLRLAEEIPDVILLDCSMPDVDGMDLLRDLRGVAPLATVPIVMMSASEDRLEGHREAGAQAAVAKPIQINELVPLLEELIAPGAATRIEGAGRRLKVRREMMVRLRAGTEPFRLVTGVELSFTGLLVKGVEPDFAVDSPLDLQLILKDGGELIAAPAVCKGFVRASNGETIMSAAFTEPSEVLKRTLAEFLVEASRQAPPSA